MQLGTSFFLRLEVWFILHEESLCGLQVSRKPVSRDFSESRLLGREAAVRFPWRAPFPMACRQFPVGMSSPLERGPGTRAGSDSRFVAPLLPEKTCYRTEAWNVSVRQPFDSLSHDVRQPAGRHVQQVIVRCGAKSGGRASTPCGHLPGYSRLRAAPVRSRAAVCAGRRS